MLDQHRSSCFQYKNMYKNVPSVKECDDSSKMLENGPIHHDHVSIAINELWTDQFLVIKLTSEPHCPRTLPHPMPKLHMFSLLMWVTAEWCHCYPLFLIITRARAMIVMYCPLREKTRLKNIYSYLPANNWVLQL